MTLDKLQPRISNGHLLAIPTNLLKSFIRSVNSLLNPHLNFPNVENIKCSEPGDRPASLKALPCPLSLTSRVLESRDLGVSGLGPLPPLCPWFVASSDNLVQKIWWFFANIFIAAMFLLLFPLDSHNNSLNYWDTIFYMKGTKKSLCSHSASCFFLSQW